MTPREDHPFEQEISTSWVDCIILLSLFGSVFAVPAGYEVLGGAMLGVAVIGTLITTPAGIFPLVLIAVVVITPFIRFRQWIAER